MVTHLTTLVRLYSYNNIALKKVGCRPKHVGENTLNGMHHKYRGVYIVYLYIVNV
jgi:hypothetical protein